MVEQTKQHATGTSFFVRCVTAMQHFHLFALASVATVLGRLWLLARAGVIPSMTAAELACTEKRLQTTSVGGDDGTHQV